MTIPIHTANDYKKMREIGKYTSTLLSEIGQIIKPEMNTLEIDEFAANFITKYNLKSACLGYKGHGIKGFPANICTSVNHVICHGIPSKEHILKEGDIISVDVTLIKEGYFGDSCRTYIVGKTTKEKEKLIEVTKKAMEIGIKEAYAGNFFGNIGYAIQTYIKEQPQKYGIVEDYCGHGIGTKFHQAPEIQHIGEKNSGIEMKEGMFFTIEPMINLGTKNTKLLSDGWTVITKDYQPSAQFEHTIGIGSNGFEIFTAE